MSQKVATETTTPANIGTPGLAPRLLCPGNKQACDCDQQHKRGDLPMGHKCGPAWQRTNHGFGTMGF